MSTDERSPRAAHRGRRRATFAGAAGLVIAGVVAAVAFQPWKLWVDDRVDQAAPQGATIVAPASATGERAVPTTTAASVAAAPTTAPPTTAPPTTAPPAAASAFVSIDHETRGSLVVLRGANGETYVRFVDLDSSNGPDLKVYLSTNAHDGPEGAFDDDFVDLGRLQGNVGSQNYLVPAGVDLSRFRSVVIWCDRFNSAFGAAPLA